MAVVTNLKEVRMQRHFYQKDLAEASGACTRSISNIEKGAYPPSLETALRLAKFLHVSVEDIFTLEEDRTVSHF